MTTTTETIIIGTYTIPEAREHRYDISETASRYEQVTLEPGTYEVEAHRGYIRRDEVKLLVRVPGTVTARYDAPEFFGQAFGDDPQHGKHAMVGEERTVVLGVGPDVVERNERFTTDLAWRWYTGVSNNMLDFNGPRRLTLNSHRGLLWADSVRRVKYRVDVPGEAPEFFSDMHAYVQRVNELLDAGADVTAQSMFCDPATGTISQYYPEHCLR